MGKIVRRAAVAAVFIVCFLFILRCCMAADKSRYSRPVVTDAIRSAWGDGADEILTVDVSRELAEDGYFAAYGFYYHPASGEAQFAVRWNRSVYRYTDMEEGHEFVFYLWNETTGERWPATAVEGTSVSVYRYRRLAASGVEASAGDQLTAVMELRDGFESTQVLKYAEQPFETWRVSGSFLKALAE